MRSGISFALLLLAVAPVFGDEYDRPKSLLIDRVERKQQALEAKKYEIEASYSARISELRNQMNSLPRNGDFSFERSNLSSQIGNLSSEQSRAVFEISREISQLRNSSRWNQQPNGRFGGRTTNAFGHDIPEWVTAWRFIDGRMEFQPRAPESTLNERRKTLRPAFDSLRDSAQKEFRAAKVDKFQKDWIDDWMVSVEKRRDDFKAESEAAIAAITEPVIKRRAQRVFEPMMADITSQVADFRRIVNAELKDRQYHADKTIPAFLDECLDAGYTVEDARIDISYLNSDESGRQVSVENKIYKEWTNGRGGNGGLKARWDAFPSLKDQIATDEKRYAPYLKAKEKVRGWQTAGYERFIELSLPGYKDAEAAHEAWKTMQEELLAKEVHPHVREVVAAAYRLEKNYRDDFFSSLRRKLDTEDNKEKRVVATWLDRIDEVFDKGNMTLEVLMDELRADYERHASDWGQEFVPWGSQWNSAEGAKATMEKYAGVETYIAEERAKYPLRYRPENCDYVYEVRLEGALNVLLRVNADNSETPVAHVEGRQSFACSKDAVVILASNYVLDKGTAEKSTLEGLAAASSVPRAFLVKDNRLVEIVNTPDALLKMAKAVVGDDGAFIVQFQDPQADWVDEFALRWDSAAKGTDVVDIEHVSLQAEVWQ